MFKWGERVCDFIEVSQQSKIQMDVVLDVWIDTILGKTELNGPNILPSSDSADTIVRFIIDKSENRTDRKILKMSNTVSES